MKFYPDNMEAVNKIQWYGFNRVFSFCVPYMYLVGGRRRGKTYGVKSFFIEDFLANGNKFAWIRSTDTALDKIRQPLQFFGRLKNLDKMGVTSYDIKKDIIYINKKVAGYLFPVATFHNTKGADYDCINGAFDEFMRAKGERPVPDKREKFFDLVESVFRAEGKRVFLISNSTNQFDDMLEPFDVTLKEFGCYLYRDKKAVVHYISPSKKHTESLEGSLSFIGMSDQEKKMAFSNQFTSYGDFGKQAKAVYLYTLQVNDAKFLSVSLAGSQLYIKNGLTPDARILTANEEYVNSKVKKISPLVKKSLKRYYDGGLIVFENGYSRTMLQEIL